MSKQVVFHSAEPRYTDEAIESPMLLRLLNGKLPSGMFAKMIIHEDWDGTTWVTTTKQARSRHGRRYDNFYGKDSAAEAQASLMRWAARILRERESEVKA